MLNGVNINYVILLLVTGSVLLAAIYHTILYGHRETKLPAGYSAYLWATFIYCAYQLVFFFNPSEAFRLINGGEVFQTLTFILYVRFASIALELHPRRGKYASWFTRITPYFVLAYLAIKSVPTITDEVEITANV